MSKHNHNLGLAVYFDALIVGSTNKKGGNVRVSLAENKLAILYRDMVFIRYGVSI